MYYTDNPIADFLRYDAEQEKQLEKLPRCSECGKHIQSDFAYYINDEWICEDCMDEYRREVVIDLQERKRKDVKTLR